MMRLVTSGVWEYFFTSCLLGRVFTASSSIAFAVLGEVFCVPFSIYPICWVLCGTILKHLSVNFAKDDLSHLLF